MPRSARSRLRELPDQESHVSGSPSAKSRMRKSRLWSPADGDAWMPPAIAPREQRNDQPTETQPEAADTVDLGHADPRAGIQVEARSPRAAFDRECRLHSRLACRSYGARVVETIGVRQELADARQPIGQPCVAVPDLAALLAVGQEGQRRMPFRVTAEVDELRPRERVQLRFGERTLR